MGRTRKDLKEKHIVLLLFFIGVFIGLTFDVVILTLFEPPPILWLFLLMTLWVMWVITTFADYLATYSNKELPTSATKFSYSGILILGIIVLVSFNYLHFYLKLNKYSSVLLIGSIILLFTILKYTSSDESREKISYYSKSVRCPFCGALIKPEEIQTQIFNCPYCGKRLLWKYTPFGSGAGKKEKEALSEREYCRGRIEKAAKKRQNGGDSDKV